MLGFSVMLGFPVMLVFPERFQDEESKRK